MSALCIQPETVRETDSLVEDPYSQIDMAADGTLYPHNPRALLTRYWLDAGGHIKWDDIESYLSKLNECAEAFDWLRKWLCRLSGDCENVPPCCSGLGSEPRPALCYPDDQRPGPRQFAAYEYLADARPGIDEVFRRDAMASRRHGSVPFYESDRKPICKVRFSEWISERPFNCAKGSLKDELAACDVGSGCAESEDEWWECEDEEEETDENMDDESEGLDQWSEATGGTLLGEEDGESNDGVETHQPGPRQLAGPLGAEDVVLINKRKGGRPHFNAPPSRAAEKARLEAMGSGFSNLAIRLKRPGIRRGGEKQNEEHQRERLERASSP